MTVQSPNGDINLISCDVAGESSRGEADFEFDCSNGDSFTIRVEKKGRNLVGFCDSNNEVELLLEPD